MTNKISVVPTRSVVDENIAHEITEALDRHGEIESGTVGVKVEKGLVTLLGTVSNWAAKNAAFLTAVYTDGVTHVDNRLSVKHP